MTFDSVPELARRVLHLEMELKRNKHSASLDAGALSKRISTLEGKVAQVQAVKPTVPQTYTPKSAAVLPKVADTSLATKVTTLERKVDLLKVKESPIISNFGRPVFLTTPLTSTSWDGDSISTQATGIKIDLSTTHSVPAGVKAVMVRCYIRDSASATTNNLYFSLGSGSTGYPQYAIRCSGLPNDYLTDVSGIVPCNADGDIYYQSAASGTGTMDVWIVITGYWL